MLLLKCHFVNSLCFMGGFFKDVTLILCGNMISSLCLCFSIFIESRLTLSECH